MAIESPTTVVFLVDIPSLTNSLIPVIAIDAKTDATAPPNTHWGIVRSSAENFGISPATIRMPAAMLNTFLDTTLVEPTIPTF